MSDVNSVDMDNDLNPVDIKLPIKVKKKGIIFLANIPPLMNVTRIAEFMSQFGDIGRVFLQPAEYKGKRGKNSKKKNPSKRFTEGWVEFLSKRVAKKVAAALNNTQVGGKKRSRSYDHIWNIKYLPKFKWIHLSERLSYERAVFKQRMRTEIAQAKREASHFAHSVERSDRQKAKLSLAGTDALQRGQLGFLQDATSTLISQYRQRETDSEIRSKKNNLLTGAQNNCGNSKQTRTEFLKSIFGN